MRVDVANAIVAEKDMSRLLKDVIDSVPTLNPNGTNQHTDIERGFDIIKPSSKGGTSAEYLAARIKRDAPEIAARIDSFPSIRAAAKAAGIIKDRAPLDVVRQVWGKADVTERQRIADWLANESGQQEWREQSLLAAWDQASEQERVELLKAIRVEHHMLEEHLNIINDNYQAGVLQLLEKNRGDWIDELREIAAERVIDKQMSWQDVLDLVKETGFGAAVDAFSQVAHEDSARRREQAVATQVEPEPKPQAPKRRRNKG
jgi:hypothetical protein